MECTCIRHTDLPHTTKLFADLVYQPERIRNFYPHPPQEPSSFSAAADKIHFPDVLRSDLVEELRRQNGDSSSLDRLAQPGTVAVLTGQQVGLFSGPAYTIYKALTAAKLAQFLTSCGIVAVPVFWLATEDHDFAEVNHTWLFDAEHRQVRVEINGAAPSNQPVGQVAISQWPLARVREALRDFPFAQEVTAMLEAAYAPGATLGEAFGTLLKTLLAKYAILHLDPMSPGVRKLAAPAMRSALTLAPALTRDVLARNKELTDAGYHAQVHVEDNTSFVFLLENGRRVALRRNNGDYVAGGRRFPTEELLERAEELSPNALLRPVIQDAILPTAAYVGGPAELAYLAQSEVIYRSILGRMPVALPRTGFTLLDSRSRKLMTRYGLQLPDFFHGEDGLRARMAARLIPPELAATLQQSRDTVKASVESLAARLAGFDKTLASAVDKSRRKIEYQLARIEGKVGREMMARDARAARDSAYLYGLIYPERHLQERFYSIIPFLARHGLDLIDHLYENVHLDCPDHQLLVV